MAINKKVFVEGKDVEEKQIEDIVSRLDGFAMSEEGRMKIRVSNEVSEGGVVREYHHGRCDINSPWARGKAFDAQTEK